MHVEVFSYGSAADVAGPARPSIWSRMAKRVRTVGTSYELDEHLARDVGATTYTVPVFVDNNQGEWK